ncbi:MAG: hypothetical protein GY862_02040, partial [Gammaproteobacteria bacterium]|nr:hypothetical protein [Gammaproteobacteria bacterium]
MTDREHDRHYAPSATVRRAIENAQILLTYAAQHKADLDRDAVKTVIDAQNALQQNAWSPEQESFFWQAFTTINRQIKPVTIGSLKAATDKRFFLFRLMSKARLSVHLYRILTAGLLTVLIVMQVYWLIGAGLVAEIDSLTKEKEQVFALEKVKREKLGQNNALENGSGLDLKPVSVEESRLARELETNYNGLLEWSRAWQKLIKQDKN